MKILKKSYFCLLLNHTMKKSLILMLVMALMACQEEPKNYVTLSG